MVKRELTVNIKDAIFWSDSKTVLQYIANESRRFHTFVANLVSEIHNKTDPTQWRHVPGHCNPADDCTRGLRAADLDHHCRWLNDPAFLSKSEEYWAQDKFIGPLRENDDEVKNTKWSEHTSVSETRAYFPNPGKFSSWTRFRRVLGWICRFVENCKRKAEYRVLSSLTATEIHNAEMIAVQKSQRDSFHLDIEALKPGFQIVVPVVTIVSVASNFWKRQGRSYGNALAITWDDPGTIPGRSLRQKRSVVRDRLEFYPCDRDDRKRLSSDRIFLMETGFKR